MLRNIGIFLLTFSLTTPAIAEELRAIEYEAMYEQFVEKSQQGRYLKVSPGFLLRNTELDLSTLKVIVETPQGKRINVEIEPEFGASTFPIDESLIGGKVLTNAPAGGLGLVGVYQLKFEQSKTWQRQDILGSIEEFEEQRDRLGFFARWLAPDLSGFAIIFDDDESPRATVDEQTIEGENSQLIIPLDLVLDSDFSVITFSTVPSDIYFTLTD